MDCDTKDIFFPFQADLFYSINEQSAYGNVMQAWYYDRSVTCSFVYAGSKFREEIKPNILITEDSLLIGRTKDDIRINSSGEPMDVTNIVVTNIRDKNCKELYTETGGPRSGKSTLFEIATLQPFINPFGKREHFSIILKRSENQGADL
jgi:hypothetical protein